LGVVGGCVRPRSDVGIMSVATGEWSEDDSVAEVHVPHLDGHEEGRRHPGLDERGKTRTMM
jgi:hypothetical protein